MQIESKPFTIASGEYLRTLIGLWLPRRWWMPTLPIVIALALAFILHDERFALIAVMLAFIVVPMGMSFFYTYYMLTPEARRAIIAKRVAVCPGRDITLIYEPQPHTDKETGEQNPVPRPEVINWKDVTRVKFTNYYVVYVLSASRLQFVMVPYDALPEGVSRESLS